MEPEEINNILNNYFEEMNIIALKYNATIDKITCKEMDLIDVKEDFRDKVKTYRVVGFKERAELREKLAQLDKNL